MQVLLLALDLTVTFPYWVDLDRRQKLPESCHCHTWSITHRPRNHGPTVSEGSPSQKAPLVARDFSEMTKEIKGTDYPWVARKLGGVCPLQHL